MQQTDSENDKRNENERSSLGDSQGLTPSDFGYDEDKDSDVEDDLTGKHPLQYRYVLWFNRRVQGARTQENYEKNIKKVGSFASVEDFWDHFSFVIRANDLPNTSDYHLFKKGIKPMWEDTANKNGGKWILRLRKGLASKYWEDLVLAIIGEQFDVGGEICGAVVSIRYQEDIISLWNKTCSDAETKQKILETMKRVLSLKDDARLEYKNHDASIRDNSSFRNTEPNLSASSPIPASDWMSNKRNEERRGSGFDKRYEKPMPTKGTTFAKSAAPRTAIQQPR